jgi:shikimate dehydrogenase
MRVFCVLSDERAFRSKSPGMHTRVLQRLGIDGVYVPFRVRAETLAAAVSGLKALNIAGANVTVPFKEAIMPYLDSIDKEATAIGAVNTIVREADAFVGYNTDPGGFMDSLRDAGFSPSGKRALVFGTGGAAKAVLFALGRLALAGITVVGRRAPRARELARAFGCDSCGLDSLGGTTISAQLLVNATSVSGAADAPELVSVIDGFHVNGCELVVDLNYGRIDNLWKQLADAVGARFMDGLPMLAHQARRSFALWTGLEVEPEYFMEALDEIQ